MLCLLGMTGCVLQGQCYYSNCKFAHNSGNTWILMSRLRNAQHEIWLSMFSLTSDLLVSTLAQCVERGVRVRVITDDSTDPPSQVRSTHWFEVNRRVATRSNMRCLVVLMHSKCMCQ